MRAVPCVCCGNMTPPMPITPKQAALDYKTRCDYCRARCIRGNGMIHTPRAHERTA